MVSSARNLFTWGRRRFGRGIGLFSTEGRLGAEIEKGLDIRKFLPFISMLTEIV
jgi:hypothetical protein